MVVYEERLRGRVCGCRVSDMLLYALFPCVRLIGGKDGSCKNCGFLLYEE